MNETVKGVPDADDTGCPEVIAEKPSPKTIRTALADFIRRFLTPYKCEGRQGVYIDKELHQKISVIVGIAGKRQLTVGNYIDNVLKEHFEKHSEEVKTGNSPETCRRQEMPGQKPSDRQRQARHAAPIAPQKKEKKQLIL